LAPLAGATSDPRLHRRGGNMLYAFVTMLIAFATPIYSIARKKNPPQSPPRRLLPQPIRGLTVYRQRPFLCSLYHSPPFCQGRSLPFDFRVVLHFPIDKRGKLVLQYPQLLFSPFFEKGESTVKKRNAAVMNQMEMRMCSMCMLCCANFPMCFLSNSWVAGSH